MFMTLLTVSLREARRRLPPTSVSSPWAVMSMPRPVLLIQSHDDYFVPASVAEYLHAHIRGSVLKTIDAEGHLPHISAPDKVVAALREFLAQR